MSSFDSLSMTLPPAYESAPVACRLLDLLPLCLEADDYFDLLLLSKLLFARTSVTREQFMQATEQRQRTGLSIEHLLVRDGHCDMTEALEVVSERRRIMRIIQQDPPPGTSFPKSETNPQEQTSQPLVARLDAQSLPLPKEGALLIGNSTWFCAKCSYFIDHAQTTCITCGRIRGSVRSCQDGSDEKTLYRICVAHPNGLGASGRAGP